MIPISNITQYLADSLQRLAGENWQISGDLAEVEYTKSGRAAIVCTGANETITGNETYEAFFTLSGGVLFSDAEENKVETRALVDELLQAFTQLKQSIGRYHAPENNTFIILGITGGAMNTEAENIAYTFSITFNVYIQL